MALSSKSPSPAPPPLSWKRFSDSPVAKRPKEDVPSESSSVSGSKDLILISKGSPQENLASRWLESIPKGVTFKPEEKCPQGNLCLEINPPQVSLSSPRDCDGKVDLVMRGQKNICERREAAPDDNTVVQMLALDSLSGGMVGKAEMRGKMRKRPAKIAIPESCVSSGFGETSEEKNMVQVFEVEGSEYCLASRKGRRHVMEDGHEVITNISGDSKQAFFGVFDGHGGRAAVDFVSEKLGKNIITALAELEKKEGQLELAIKAGYLTTDREFLSQGVSSGACAATVLLKDGELHVANVGDCRVVMSRKGVANALTIDHRAGREDERTRIENLGGYVGCRNGVWRVQDSLAVSRAIGDMSMKKWIISEPETKKLRLTSDCEFLIIASDGLWDKVTNQEAVDVVLKHKNSIKSCRDLVDISSSRGSRDDITVMVVDLQRFAQCGR